MLGHEEVGIRSMLVCSFFSGRVGSSVSANPDSSYRLVRGDTITYYYYLLLHCDLCVLWEELGVAVPLTMSWLLLGGQRIVSMPEEKMRSIEKLLLLLYVRQLADGRKF